MSGTMTVEEFARLPEISGVREELVNGQVLRMPPPTFNHQLLSLRIREALAGCAAGEGIVGIEIPYIPAGHDHVFVADVAAVSDRLIAISAEQAYLAGSPEIVVEVVSSSNTAEDILRRERLTLAGGAQEFWAVYPEDRVVRISYADGRIATYAEADTVPVPLFNASVPAAQLFG